jgi:uncharacterized membrane protein YfcA
MIPLDKLLHVGAGMLIAMLAVSLGLSRYQAFAAAVGIGAIWEIIQYVRKRGTVEVWDAVATAFGGAAGALVACLHCGGGA